MRGGRDRPAVVQRAAQRIDDAARAARPDRHAHHFARAAHGSPASMPIVHRRAARSRRCPASSVCDEAHDAAVEAQQFIQPHMRQAGDEGDAVADRLRRGRFPRRCGAERGPRDRCALRARASRQARPAVIRHLRSALHGFGRGRRANCCAAMTSVRRAISKPAISFGSTRTRSHAPAERPWRSAASRSASALSPQRRRCHD